MIKLIKNPASGELFSGGDKANEQAMIGFDHQEALQQSKAGIPDCYVAIDIESLSPFIAAAKNKDPISSPLIQKTLSRKGSRRGGGGERKPAAGDTTTTTTTLSSSVGADPRDKSSPVVYVAHDQEPSGQPHATATTTSTGGGGGRYRKLGNRTSPWLDPRRVLLFFATLSSMGTLILLYFILSMGKTDGGDANTR